MTEFRIGERIEVFVGDEGQPGSAWVAAKIIYAVVGGGWDIEFDNGKKLCNVIERKMRHLQKGLGSIAYGIKLEDLFIMAALAGRCAVGTSTRTYEKVADEAIKCGRATYQRLYGGTEDGTTNGTPSNPVEKDSGIGEWQESTGVVDSTRSD